MRRWNGWGDDGITYHLPSSASRFLENLVGLGSPPSDAALANIVKTVPTSKLPRHPLITTDPVERLKHARGQSLPDWIAVRSGRIETYPDGVAYPDTPNAVRELVTYAAASGIRLIPYGGGTSVVGHITPMPGEAPVLTVDLCRLNKLQRFDETSLLATFGPGVTGPDLEAQLQAHGYTLGHFPQSFELSTLGGWIATRSSGQQSIRYGRIEKLFAGGVLESPVGRLELPSHPASAAGPDLREMVLGSEGRFGILTEATVRVTPLPVKEDFHAVFFPDFAHGQAAVRQIAQSGIPLLMLRLSTAIETITTLALAGHESLIGMVEKYLSMRGLGGEKCMLIFGVGGRRAMVRASLHETLALSKKHSGIHIGRTFGRQWHKNRFRTPYLRNTLWEIGYAIDTVETAVDWSSVPTMVTAIEEAIRPGLADGGERVHVFTHLSHIYPWGSSVYTTYLFRLARDPEENLRCWHVLKERASQAIVTHRGTISHQHGVGIDHRPYLSVEKGSLGMAVLGDLCKRFDPQGLMNPGKLLG